MKVEMKEIMKKGKYVKEKPWVSVCKVKSYIKWYRKIVEKEFCEGQDAKKEKIYKQQRENDLPKNIFPQSKNSDTKIRFRLKINKEKKK